jgi:hypothetical protein
MTELEPPWPGGKPCSECFLGTGACTWRNVQNTPPTCRMIPVVTVGGNEWPISSLPAQPTATN